MYPDEKELLIKAGSYFVIENISFVPIVYNVKLHTAKSIIASYNMKMITLRLCNNINEAIEYSKTFGNTYIIYGYFEDNILIGGRKDEFIVGSKISISKPYSIVNPYRVPISKPNYIINPYTVMISASTFNNKYKYIDSYDDIINAYVNNYFLFTGLFEKYNNVVKIVDTEKLRHAKNQKTRFELPVKLPVKSIFPSVTNPNYATAELTGGMGNNEYYYKKYMKYKYKYDHFFKL